MRIDEFGAAWFEVAFEASDGLTIPYSIAQVATGLSWFYFTSSPASIARIAAASSPDRRAAWSAGGGRWLPTILDAFIDAGAVIKVRPMSRRAKRSIDIQSLLKLFTRKNTPNLSSFQWSFQPVNLLDLAKCPPNALPT
jgi:hypothetical protein